MGTNTKAPMFLANLRAEGGTVGATDQFMKVSSKTECETVKGYGVLMERTEMFTKDNTKTT